MQNLLANVDIVRGPDARPHVFIGNKLSIQLTQGARGLDNFVAVTSAKKYLRQGAALFGALELVAQQTQAEVDAWSPPHLSKHLWRGMLEALGCRLIWRPKFLCYVVTPPEHLHGEVVTGLAAASHLYDAAREAGVALYNPLVTRLPEKRGDTVSLFRPKIVTGSVRTTRKPADVAQVLAAIRTTCPPHVNMLFELMAVGLARVSEQARLSVWDWAQSGFDLAIATPNKGDGFQRTKTQLMTAPLWARMIHWFDHDRKDPNGLDREEYSRLSRTPVGRLQMSETPLFPSHRGGFYTYSGLVDYHFRPAMTGDLAHTVTHALRIAGVNDFIAWVEAKPISRAEKEREKAKFAVHMGWRWPDKMLEYYGAPHNLAQSAATAAAFAADREKHLAAAAQSPETLLRQAPARPRAANYNFDKMMRLQARS
ncbi:MAG TPA: hypothetical protein VF680_07495 [Allosphingosinicella sp.]|jgi:hypothetical protein